MNVCEEISQTLKKQNISILEKSAVIHNTKESHEYISELDIFMVKKKDQSINVKNIFNAEEIRFGFLNDYFEFCLKPGDSDQDRTEILYKDNCKAERKQVLPFIFRNSVDFSAARGIENDNDSFVGRVPSDEKKPQEAIPLESVPENKTYKKRKHEDENFVTSLQKECNFAGKNNLLNTEKERCMGNPYLEYILKSEDSNLDESSANNIIPSIEEKNKNRVDIFGNHFTSKDRNKFKAICPHCTKKVPAPGFVRHLAYCMKVKIRKRTRRA